MSVLRRTLGGKLRERKGDIMANDVAVSHYGVTGHCHRENGDEYIQSFPIFHCIYYWLCERRGRRSSCTLYVENRAVVKLALSFHLDVASGDPLSLVHHRAGPHAHQLRPWCSEQVTAALGCVHCARLWLFLFLFPL